MTTKYDEETENLLMQYARGDSFKSFEAYKADLPTKATKDDLKHMLHSTDARLESLLVEYGKLTDELEHIKMQATVDKATIALMTAQEQLRLHEEQAEIARCFGRNSH